MTQVIFSHLFITKPFILFSNKSFATSVFYFSLPSSNKSALLSDLSLSHEVQAFIRVPILLEHLIQTNTIFYICHDAQQRKDFDPNVILEVFRILVIRDTYSYPGRCCISLTVHSDAAVIGPWWQTFEAQNETPRFNFWCVTRNKNLLITPKRGITLNIQVLTHLANRKFSWKRFDWKHLFPCEKL